MNGDGRLYDGFGILDGGMDGGQDASLIEKNQCAMAVNFTFRDSFAAVRPSFSNVPLNFPNLIPSGALYIASEYDVTALLIPGDTFIITWGNNDVEFVYGILGPGEIIINSPGSGKQTIITIPVGNNVGHFGNIGTPSQPVTASLAQTLQGYFQGAAFYQSNQPGQSSLIASISGRLFQITLGNKTSVTDITPQVPLVTTANFSVPTSSNNPVNIQINNDAGILPTGSIFYISGGEFQVTAVFGNLLNTEYLGGYTAPTVNVQTASAFTVPAPSSNVTILVNNPGALAPTNTVKMDGGSYTVVSVNGNSVVLTYGSGSNVTEVLAFTTLTNGSNVPYTYSNYLISSGASLTNVNGGQLFFNGANPATLPFVNIFQAETYEIILAGQNSTQIFNGSTVNLAGDNQLPPGLFGTYQWGRIWITLNDQRSFVAGDLIGDASGTAQNQFVDAILFMTENKLLSGGGAFKVPNNSGLINAMGVLPTLDTSLGAGQILVGTSNSIIGVNAPVDRTTWQNLSYPIQSVSTMGYGPIGPNCMFTVNGDVWFRSLDGMRSFQVKRRDFQQWNDAPQSQEMNQIFGNDTPYLLFFGSGTGFDNKLFQTISPFQTPYGVVHRGMAVLNFDLISDLREKRPPTWEGIYTGLQILQIVYGVVDTVERCFMFVLSPSNTIELWEINDRGRYDLVKGNNTLAYVPIQSQLNTRRMDFGQPEQLKSLYTAELYIDQISDNVQISIKWLPDEYPTWTPWVTLNFCADNQQCTLTPPVAGQPCVIFKENATQYAARVMLTAPPEIVNALNNGYLHQGYEFQFRFEGTGHFRIRKFKPHAKIVSQEMEGVQQVTQCQALPICNLPVYGYNSYGT